MALTILMLLAGATFAAGAAIAWAIVSDRRHARKDISALRFYSPGMETSTRSIMRYLVVRAACGAEDGHAMAERWLRAGGA